MVLPGHLAIGYITVRALVAVVHPDISQTETTLLIIFGIISGDLPDVDILYHFIKNKTSSPERLGNHRHYVTHAPLVWFIGGLLVFIFSKTPFCKMIGLMLWLGPWSHFVADSIDYGVMWLWPFSKRRYALCMLPGDLTNQGDSSWGSLFGGYTKRYTFYAEIVAIAIAVVLFLVS